MLVASRPEAQKRLTCTPDTRLGVARDDRGGARDVGALLADRHDAAQHHVVDQVGVELVAVADRLQRR